MTYWRIFTAFFKIGILGYGGGPSMIPLFYSECVKRNGWVSAEDFSDYLALGNALPGPIATKMASYIGYVVKGWKGSLVAISAVSLPIVIAMIVLLNFIYQLREMPMFQGMIQAIQPVIGVMMAVLAYEFISKGWKESNNKGGTAAIGIVAVIAIPLLGIHPGIVIAFVLFIAFVYATWIVRKGNQGNQGTSK